MLRLVLSAIGRRRGPAAILLLLATVAAAGGAAAPGYIAASAESLAASAVTYAEPAERLISVEASVPLDGGAAAAVDAFNARIRDTLRLPGFDPIAGLRAEGRYGKTDVVLAYRRDACAHLIIRGACPARPGQVAVSSALAARLGLAVGGSGGFLPDQATTPVSLTIVGVFAPRQPTEPYWGPIPRSSDGRLATTSVPENVLFTSLDTFAGPIQHATASVDLLATPAAFRATDPQQLALRYEQRRQRLVADHMTVQSDIRTLANRVWDDQQLIFVAVPIGAVELLVLCWFALFLAVRQSAEDRRIDVAKLKLHGARRRDIWALVVGQSAMPLLVGGVAGLFLGRWLAVWAAGDIARPWARTQAWYASLAAVAAAILGALLATMLAERRMLSQPVGMLGRRVGAHRPGWAALVFDGTVIGLAVVGAIQVGLHPDASGQAGGLAVAAPLLVALAIGLIVARLVPVAAAGSARGMLRSRRIGLWLIALHLARRPAVPRVLAVLTLAVAVFCGTVLSWGASARARTDRVAFEVGAATVLTVRAPSRAALLDAVRAVDPAGRYAMAAVQTGGALPVLAVDSSRLASVAPWQAGYGAPNWSDVAALLHPPAPAPFVVSGGALRLDATWRGTGPVPHQVPGAGSSARAASGDAGPAASPGPGTGQAAPSAPGTGPVLLEAQLIRFDGSVSTVRWGPLTEGRHSYEATIAGCTPAEPCRLAALGLAPGAASARVADGASVELHSLTQAGPDRAVVSPAEFADRTRWRNDLVPGAVVPLLTASVQGLVITVAPVPTPGRKGRFPALISPLDTPTPLPVLAAGALPDTGEIGDKRLALFGGAAAPVSVAGNSTLIPRVGSGAVMVDLAYADRLLAGQPGVGGQEVWLSADAPANLSQRLAALGVQVTGEDSAAERLARLDEQGPAVALRFLLLIAAGGMLLALGSFTVTAAVEREPRGAELASLRRQGVSRRTVRLVAFGGYVAFVVTATVTGVATAYLVRSFGHPEIFADGWRVLAPPPSPLAITLLAGVGPVAVLGAGAALAGLRLLGAVRDRRQEA